MSQGGIAGKAVAAAMLVAACARAPDSSTEASGLPAGYHLVWSDEFETPGLPDPSRWAYDTERNAQGWHNNERQYYSAERAENARVVDGVLIIEARREPSVAATLPAWNGQPYTSARLLTRGRAAWTYGFFEVRAKLPCGVGTWPAIWMLSAPPQTAWPDDGEIDIMEHVGFDPGVVHGTVHTGAYNHARGTQRGASIELPDACEAFHRYQLTWTPERMVVGVDDQIYFEFANEGAGEGTWPFDSPQYLILNIAVGGDWGGREGVNDAVFPVRMEVDYVRIYQATR